MIKDHPKISIVIPSYNSDSYIGKTLDSIVLQNYPNLEVIIQDGGSTDATVEIIKKYSAKHSFIKWVSKKDKGQLDAINKGFEKATGDILTYINSDDLYERGAFEKVADTYKKYPNSLWFAGRGKVIDKDGIEIAKTVTNYKNFLLSLNSYNLLLTTNYLMQPSVFITREAFKKYGPFTGTSDFILEYDLWLKLAQVQMPKIIEEDLSLFRLSGENISSTKYSDLLEKDLEIVKKYTKNPLILFLHKLNNLGRVASIKRVI